ncbi:MAG: major facilitator superfamily 1 [Bryobacterales bacterium]|nr:major facilitator superfamily 1 [Bryobacterales bacterium]
MTNRRWGIAILLGVGVLVNYFDRVNLSVSKDALFHEFGISTFMFGLLSSAFNWTYAALQLPVGVLLDRFGVGPIGRIGALLWAIASFASALSPGIGSFFGSRLLLGVGEAPTFPANAKAIGYWFPRSERSLATALFDGAAKFGPAVGVVLVGALTVRFGWRWSFAATGLISFFFFLAFWFLYRDPDQDGRMSAAERSYIEAGGAQKKNGKGIRGGAPLGYLLKQRKVLGLVLGFFAYNYCFYLLLYWLPSYFGTLKLDTFHSAMYTSIPWLFATATDVLVGGWLVDALIKRGKPETTVRQTVLITGTVLGLALAGAMWTRDPVVAVFWISIALGGLSAAAPVGWSIPSLIAPTNSVGKVGSILNTGNQIAGIAAPILTGYLAGPQNSFGRAFAVAAGLLVLGVLSYVLLLGRIEQVPEPHPRADSMTSAARFTPPES